MIFWKKYNQPINLVNRKRIISFSIHSLRFVSLALSTHNFFSYSNLNTLFWRSTRRRYRGSRSCCVLNRVIAWRRLRAKFNDCTVNLNDNETIWQKTTNSHENSRPTWKRFRNSRRARFRGRERSRAVTTFSSTMISQRTKKREREKKTVGSCELLSRLFSGCN